MGSKLTFTQHAEFVTLGSVPPFSARSTKVCCGFQDVANPLMARRVIVFALVGSADAFDPLPKSVGRDC